MRGRLPFIAVLGMFGAVYAVSPFVALYRLQSAVRGGDAPALASLIDWSSVREGIKEDICDLVLDEPGDVAQKGQLPAFGASFVRGVTSNSVDRELTPEALAGMARPSSDQPADDASISWAFFSSPAHFTIDVSLAGHLEPIQAVLALKGLQWRVVRIRIPPALLQLTHWTA